MIIPRLPYQRALSPRWRWQIKKRSMFSSAIRSSTYTAPSVKSESSINKKKVTVKTFDKLYREKQKITIVTAHDYFTGLMADRSGMDAVLVGDSLAMVALGYQSTNQLSMDEMIYHASAVVRGASRPLVIADMVFGSYEISPAQALQSAITMVQKSQIDGVKLEGGIEFADTIQKITSVGIPVLGHIGLLPQRAASFGGFKIQGKTCHGAKRILDDAIACEKAGCFAIVIEAVPAPIAELITSKLSIPTIGIGAGPNCSGQVLVALDMLGGYDKFLPKFVKRYGDIMNLTCNAFTQYASDVRSGSFPTQDHTYDMPKDELEKFRQLINS